jgi:hypothetical protein
MTERRKEAFFLKKGTKKLFYSKGFNPDTAVTPQSQSFCFFFQEEALSDFMSVSLKVFQYDCIIAQRRRRMRGRRGTAAP